MYGLFVVSSLVRDPVRCSTDICLMKEKVYSGFQLKGDISNKNMSRKGFLGK